MRQFSSRHQQLTLMLEERSGAAGARLEALTAFDVAHSCPVAGLTPYQCRQ
jgi:hypothetical protein